MEIMEKRRARFTAETLRRREGNDSNGRKSDPGSLLFSVISVTPW